MPTSALWVVTNSPGIFVEPVHSAWADVGIGPYKWMRTNAVFFRNLQQICNIDRADRVVRPYEIRGDRSLAVGADDSVGPLGSYEFAGDFRRTGAFCVGRVGIGPYNKIWQRIRICVGFMLLAAACCNPSVSFADSSPGRGAFGRMRA